VLNANFLFHAKPQKKQRGKEEKRVFISSLFAPVLSVRTTNFSRKAAEEAKSQRGRKTLQFFRLIPQRTLRPFAPPLGSLRLNFSQNRKGAKKKIQLNFFFGITVKTLWRSVG
jgi:hypothetical protein